MIPEGLFYVPWSSCHRGNVTAQQVVDCLGDLAAGTLVISNSESTRPAAVEDIEPLAPSIALSRSEQTSIVHFMQRSSQISQPRQQELASILEGTTHQRGEDGVERLRRYGAWFLGVR